MHGVRLDPFSSRLLAIRLKHGNSVASKPLPEPVADNGELEVQPEPTDAAFASDEEADEPYMPSRSAPDARAPIGASVGEVTGALLPDVVSHAVAATDCETCDDDARTNDQKYRELFGMIRTLQGRVESLEYAAQHFKVSAHDAAVDQGIVSESLLG